MKFIRKILSGKHFKDWALILTLLSFVTYSVQLNSTTLQTSLLSSPQHAPFDGTVMPIQKVPDWTYTNSTEQSLNYHELSSSKLIDIPQYRNDYLTFPSSSLIWGNKEHDVIRNTKITFSVPYAGSYNFDDSGEGGGSHPAVDIKALKGTPVYAVANGVVSKSSQQSSGFGNHLVLKHNDVSKPGSRSQTIDLYSSYSHLSKIFVSEGDVVQKGQVIGEVGDSGTSTTNHLHFQLDSTLAPWHPYWPFTSTEAAAAGYSFWDAVSEGLGKDNVYKYTYNPMTWVNENLNGSVVEEVIATTDIDTEPVSDPEPVVEEPVVEEPIIESSVVKVDFNEIEISGPEFVIISNNETFKVSLLDADGNKVSKPDFDGQIRVSLSEPDLGNLNRDFISKEDFSNGKAELKLYAEREGALQLNFEFAGDIVGSYDISFISSVNPFARFGVYVDGIFTPNIAESVIIRALDADGNPTPSFSAGGKIELSIIQGSGTFSKDILTAEDFRNGVAEVEFFGEGDEDVVILALYGRARAESKLMKAKLFSDLSVVHENYKAVSYLFKKGTISGYPDGTFKPAQTVSRVEALKFIFSGMDQDVKENLKLDFKDTYDSEWYAPFVATAQSLGIVQGYSDGTFRPSQGVNRVEFLKMLFSTTGVSVDPVVIDAPYLDIPKLSWFGPYVQYAKNKNLFPVDGDNFYPSNPMDRSEVAEVIYRMLLMQVNGSDMYIESLGGVE